MSILFPKVNRPRGFDHRPIYYDERTSELHDELMKRRAAKEAEKANQANQANQANRSNQSTPEGYRPTLHRGSFREAVSEYESYRVSQSKKANRRLAVIVVALGLVLLVVWLAGKIAVG